MNCLTRTRSEAVTDPAAATETGLIAAGPISPASGSGGNPVPWVQRMTRSSFVSRLTLLTLAAVSTGCAGYRGGWESVPYLGETPPVRSGSRTPYEARKLSEITLPGMTLGVSINNRLRTYDTQVYLFVLPLSVDPRNVQTEHVEAGKTRINLRISDMTTDWNFRPRRARLTVGTQVVEGVAGFEFAMWDAQGRKVDSGGHWEHRATGDETVLVRQGDVHLVSIDFPVSLPSPEGRDISLDLSEALTSPPLPGIPVIRFAPIRWKEGYTWQDNDGCVIPCRVVRSAGAGRQETPAAG